MNTTSFSNIFNCNSFSELNIKMLTQISEFSGLPSELLEQIFKNSRTFFQDLWTTYRHNEDMYSLPFYNCSTLECFNKLSYFYVEDSIKHFKKNNIIPESILDFAGGCGLTSIMLAKSFPNAVIYYYDCDSQRDFLQQILDSKIFGEIKNIKILSDISKIESVDAIYLLEFLEHTKEPITFIEDVISKIPHKYLCESSPFIYYEAGHYLQFRNRMQIYSAKDFEQIFNNFLYESYIIRYTKPNYKFNILESK